MLSQTVCRDCIFAQYENKKQTGCQIGRLKKLDENGANIFSAYDEEKEFFLIAGRICMYCRDSNWAKLYPQNTNLVAMAQQEMKVKYNAIVLSNNRTQATLDTLASIFSQTIRPKHITVLRYDTDTTPGHLFMKYLKNHCRGQKISWKIQTIQDHNMSLANCVDIVLDIEKHPYYLSTDAGTILPPKLIEEINFKVNEDLLKFAMIKIEDNTIFMNRAVHDHYHGNRGGTLEEKIEEEKCQNMIFKAEEILPLYQK